MNYFLNLAEKPTAMAKFLDTTGVSYHLEQLIKTTKDKLVLVSPYLQFSERIKEQLSNLNILKKDIRIIYRENKLHPEENNWLESQIGIRTSLCKNLHAKCYINENAAIITSMNLYEFSQQNNNEMGVLITKEADPELFKDTWEETQRLLTISEEIRISVKKVYPSKSNGDFKKENNTETKNFTHNGFCIRTGVPIPFNIEKPLSKEAYKKGFTDRDSPEKFCHFSGEKSKGETSMNKPVLKKNWNKAKEIYNL